MQAREHVDRLEHNQKLSSEDKRNILIGGVNADWLNDKHDLYYCEHYKFDAFIVAQVLEFISNKELFDDLKFKGSGSRESYQDYEKSVKAFLKTVELVKKTATFDFDVIIPARPRDKAFELISRLKKAGYSDEIIDNFWTTVKDHGEFHRKTKKTDGTESIRRDWRQITLGAERSVEILDEDIVDGLGSAEKYIYYVHTID